MSEQETLFSGDFLRLCRTGRWEYVQRVNAQGAAVIVAVTPDDELLLVEQPRPALGGPVIELPAGLVGDIPGAEDEARATAAARELEEETGWRPDRMRYLTGGPPSAGLSGETLWFFRAISLTRVGDGGGDDSEDITVHTIGLDDVDAWLAEREAAGIPVDPKVYTGLYFIRCRPETAS
ncbi:NUDIX hydrolase [Salinisphaera sp. Q1T1-3]|uniref:NUDIX hydrolase n=1 Tax=Salinisphaera sp. Q1T1-3 TaxID=2321229 RepID=UPI000E72FB15|nr:NUDIX hydrolase [Salinisphaera sp. Q1T1-3]RJS92499.1 NUDIX hydrolase [Salinisphaera sp. Q1T1-3]